MLWSTFGIPAVISDHTEYPSSQLTPRLSSVQVPSTPHLVHYESLNNPFVWHRISGGTKVARSATDSCSNPVYILTWFKSPAKTRSCALPLYSSLWPNVTGGSGITVIHPCKLHLCSPRCYWYSAQHHPHWSSVSSMTDCSSPDFFLNHIYSTSSTIIMKVIKDPCLRNLFWMVGLWD